MSERVLRIIWRWLPLMLVLSVPLLLLAGEWQYTHSVSPKEVRTIDDHLARFGMPKFITHVKRKGDPQSYFELSGFPNGKMPRLAFPSARPAYIYNSSGTLVDWCRDSGDTNQWRKVWRPISEATFDVQPVIRQLQKAPPNSP